MLGTIERLKRNMELQLDVGIFLIDDQSLFKLYGEISCNRFSNFRLLVYRHGCKINKYVFDKYNAGKIKDIFWQLHHTWSYESDYEEDEILKLYDEIKSDTCFDLYYYELDKKFDYYIKLNKIYEHILDDITDCKTLPNKRYTQQKRCVAC